jgi:hypothetical protein
LVELQPQFLTAFKCAVKDLYCTCLILKPKPQTNSKLLFMKTFSTPKKWGSLMIAALILSHLISCQKPLSDERVPTPISSSVDLTTKVSSTVSGFVTDENDVAVQSAAVKVGSRVATTDKYGFFEVKNEQVVKNAATVTVTVPGYFTGIRTYIAEQNKSAFVRIKLIPKTNSGNFSGSTGGSVILTNGLKISLPANAVANAITGSVYTGTVNVASSWLNPAAADLDRIMPGDLRALDAAGGFKQLITYGMAAIELTGSGGEKLQVATGKKATLSFPILLAQAGSAPANIPLWYFDEAVGLWKEEGSAVKNGNNYEGEVSHFSFWNCDVPANFVQVNMTVKDSKGSPVAYSQVKISRVSNPGSAAFGYTDSSGYVSGAVPSNEQLKLEIFSASACGTPIHTQTFTTASTNLSLGVITINTTTGLATITGTATTCANTPVLNGFIIMKKGNQYYRFPLSNTGSFNFTTILCNNATTAVQLIAEDITGGQQSNPSNYSIVGGNNVLGNLQACGVTTQQFLNLTINGISHNYTAPVDSLTLRPEQSGNTISNFYLGAARMVSPYQNTYIAWSGQGIALGSTQPLIMFATQVMNDSTTMMAPINVNITELGIAGQFVSGNFTGAFKGAAPTNTVYNVTCSFRVRRYF